MSTLKLLTSSVIGSALLVSCSEAQFYGNSPSRANAGAKPGQTLSCSVPQTTVKVGGMVAIAVSDSTADGELSQTLIQGDKKTESTLSLQNGLYVIKGEGPNLILAD